MPTKHQLKAINDAAWQEQRPVKIDPAAVDVLPDNDTDYRLTGLLAGPGGTWHCFLDLPGAGQVGLSVTDAERNQHGF